MKVKLVRGIIHDVYTVFINDRVLHYHHELGLVEFPITNVQNVLTNYPNQEILNHYNAPDGWLDINAIDDLEQLSKFPRVNLICTKLVQYGDTKIHNALISHNAAVVRSALVAFGNDDHRDVLVNDLSLSVRGEVARYGNDTHRDILVSDPIPYVRCKVAQYGTDRHRDILLDDIIGDVLECVAYYGNDEHRTQLATTEFPQVQLAILSKSQAIRMRDYGVQRILFEKKFKVPTLVSYDTDRDQYYSTGGGRSSAQQSSTYNAMWVSWKAAVFEVM